MMKNKSFTPSIAAFLQNTAVHILFIILVVCLAYSNTLTAPFALDDIATL